MKLELSENKIQIVSYIIKIRKKKHTELLLHINEEQIRGGMHRKLETNQLS